MNRNPGILLLCSSRIAVPVVKYLAGEQALCGLAVPDKHQEVVLQFRELAASLDLPLLVLSRSVFRDQLSVWLGALRPDAVMVIGFPWRIPVSVLPPVPYGFLNFHAGLLPEMRGPDPLFECIRRRLTRTGLTVHHMDDTFDHGPVILREELELSPEATHGFMGTQMAYKAEEASRQLLALMREGQALPAKPQDESQAAYWPRIRPSELCICWESMSSLEIKALVKACNPLLKGATAMINGWGLKVLEVSDTDLSGDAAALLPGMILYSDPQQGLIVYCSDGRGLRLEVVGTEEGMLPGYKLAYFGIGPGMRFSDPVLATEGEFLSN